ncbi:MAG TPA: ABC transporter substrate-binding protein [Acidimicrobiales bacterium]|nr:ABC transporter substrate-binding protein [Acidimicrobiales bacterium]
MRVVGRRAGLAGCAALVLAGTVLAACGNAATTVSTSGNTQGVYPNRIVVGGLSSITGPLPADFAPAIAGAQAYFDLVNADGGVNGRKIDFAYRLDDQSDPSLDASQARTLVQQDHVFAVVPVATPSFSGGPFLSQHDVPTFGLNVNPNVDWAGPSMYGNTGSYTAFTSAQLQAAYLAEQHDVRAAALIAYNISQSRQGCQGVANAFHQYGIRIAFEDLAVPVPAFDLQADVTRMKSLRVDMVTSCLDLTGDILLSHTMQQDGMTGVTQYWFDGYDVSALKTYASAMQGVYFMLQHVPFEVTQLYPRRYPSMDRFEAALKRYAPGNPPSEAALAGWTSADLFVTGLRAIGRDVTRTRLVAAINKMTLYTAHGLVSPIDWRTDHTGVSTIYNCSVFVQVQGNRFVPVYTTPPSVFSCFPVPNPAHGPIRKVVPLPPGVPPLTVPGGGGG